MAQNRMANPYLANFIKYAAKELGVQIADINKPTDVELINTALALHTKKGWTQEGLEVIVGKGRIDSRDPISQRLASERITYAIKHGMDPSSEEVMRDVYMSFWQG